MNDDINDINKTRSLKAKRWRIAFFIFGMFAFSALFYWVLWAVALKEMMPSGIWPFLIFIIFQLLLAIISYVSYKVSSKRWNREIAKKLDRIPYRGYHRG